MSTDNDEGLRPSQFLMGAGGYAGAADAGGISAAARRRRPTPPFLASSAAPTAWCRPRPARSKRGGPRKLGALTQAAMLADKPTRATGELSDYADRLLLVRGVGHAWPSTGCNHASGCAQILTGTATIAGTRTRRCLQRISRHRDRRAINPAGRRSAVPARGDVSGGRSGSTSRRTSRTSRASQQRPGIDSPLKAYQTNDRDAGARTTGSAADPWRCAARASTICCARRSRRCARGPELTADDQQRLDQHFATIRDMEIKITSAALSAGQDRPDDRRSIPRPTRRPITRSSRRCTWT